MEIFVFLKITVPYKSAKDFLVVLQKKFWRATMEKRGRFP